jgi:hypothetical protein
MSFFTTGKSTTVLTPTLVIDDVGSGILTALGSVPIKAAAGDAFVIGSQIEFTLPYTYNCNTAIQLNKGATPTDLTGAKIFPAAGMNVTKDMHHIARVLSTVYQFTADFEGYLNLLGFAAASLAAANDTLNVATSNFQLSYLQIPASSTGRSFGGILTVS